MCGWGSGTGVWMVLWGLIWMALLVLLILGIVWLARKAVRPSGRTGRSEWDAEGTLRRRYAAGRSTLRNITVAEKHCATTSRALLDRSSLLV